MYDAGMKLPKDLVAASAVPLVLSILEEGESYGYTIIQRVRELSDGAILVRNVDRGIALAFHEAREFGRRRALASRSFWWTIGGEGFRPLVLSRVGLPSAVRFADMLTGAFAEPEVSALGDAT